MKKKLLLAFMAGITLCIPLISQTTIFNYTGSVQTYTVPVGVTSITVDVQGAQGGNGPVGCGGYQGPGGLGGRTQATVTVTPGDVLSIYVGGAGANDNNSSAAGGFNGGGNAMDEPNYTYYGGGGGGGASDIRLNGNALTNRIVVAGGGGGGGSDGCTCNGLDGGIGGGLTGGNGNSGSICSCNPSGQGGSQVAGGVKGDWGCSCDATAGVLGIGGNSNSSSCGGPTGGGAGGGGYYGGGGGGLGAGGGGSNYSIPAATAVTNTAGFRSGNGFVTITVTCPPITGTTVVTNVSCFGGSNGAINLTPNGGISPYTFNWLPSGPTTQNRTGLTAGTYSVQITDANGCTGTVIATVTQPASPVSGTTVVTNVACFGGSNGAINLTPTGGTPGYTFNWLPSGPTTEDRTGLVAGTYTVIITDANACTGTVTATVTQPASPVSGSTVVTNIACFGGSNGAINLTPSGGTPGYTYNWLPSGPTTEDRTGLTAGTYSVQITDANGCTGTVTATVTQPASPVSGTTVVTNVSCFGGSNGAINLTPNGGTPGYTYNWLPSGPTTQNRTGLTAGTYSVQITDANGCTGTVTITVTQPASPVSGTTVVTNVSCFGGSNGAINLTPNGGTPGYTYNWLPSGPTTEDRTGLTAGTYSVQITDANGCTGTVTATINQPTALVATSSATAIMCNGGNATVTVSATGGNSPYTGTGSFTVTAGTYSYTVTDANSCTTTTTITVTQPTALVATSSASAIMCNGGNATVTVSATGGNSPYTGTGTFTVTAGTYSYTVTDANSCTTTTTITVTQPTALAATSSATSILCNGGNSTVTVSATGGTSPYTGTGTFTVTAGTYSYTVTDANSCTTTTTITVTEPTAISVSATQINVSCFGGNNGSIDLTVTGGTGPYTFDWNSGMYTVEDPSGLTAGTYAGTLTDANGCTDSGTIIITEPTALVATSSASAIMCNGGNATVTVSATGGTSPYSGTGTFTVTAGTYSYTVTDANSCTTTTTITVTEPTALAATSSTTSILCNGGNATVTVSATGGTAPYTGTGTFTETAGIYSYTITDANSCTTTTTITVTEPTAISVSSTQVNVSCFGGNDGSIDITVTGGTAPYTFDWNSGMYTVEDPSGLTAGNYAGVLTDANGCTDGGTIIITEPTALVATLVTANNPTSCGGTDGSIDISVSGGTAAYSYLWNTSATTEDLSGIGAGAYSNVVTDSNGCSTTITGNLSDPNAPSVSVLFDTTLCVSSAAYTLTEGSPAGGIWSGTAVTGNTFDPASAGIGSYILSYTYTDVNGCTGSASDTLLVDACLNIDNQIINNFSVMPNPNNGNFTLQLNTTEAADVLIYNAMGQLVSKQKVQPNIQQQINITNSGVYLITVITSNGQRTAQRVIVNR